MPPKILNQHNETMQTPNNEIIISETNEIHEIIDNESKATEQSSEILYECTPETYLKERLYCAPPQSVDVTIEGKKTSVTYLNLLYSYGPEDRQVKDNLIISGFEIEAIFSSKVNEQGTKVTYSCGLKIDPNNARHMIFRDVMNSIDESCVKFFMDNSQAIRSKTYSKETAEEMFANKLVRAKKIGKTLIEGTRSTVWTRFFRFESKKTGKIFQTRIISPSSLNPEGTTIEPETVIGKSFIVYPKIRIADIYVPQIGTNAIHCYLDEVILLDIVKSETEKKRKILGSISMEAIERLSSQTTLSNNIPSNGSEEKKDGKDKKDGDMKQGEPYDLLD